MTREKLSSYGGCRPNDLQDSITRDTRCMISLTMPCHGSACIGISMTFSLSHVIPFCQLVHKGPDQLLSQNFCRHIFYVRDSSVGHQASYRLISSSQFSRRISCSQKKCLDGKYTETLGKQLKIVIKASDIDEGSLIVCLVCLVYHGVKHPTRGNLEIWLKPATCYYHAELRIQRLQSLGIIVGVHN
jgi:hypothetical protein